MTNGLVTITENGHVVMKIVCGCDGMRAPMLAAAIRSMGEVPLRADARRLAHMVGFGCCGCLVIQTPGLKRPPHCEMESGAKRYEETFDDPRANPRWEHEADYTEVVEL